MEWAEARYLWLLCLVPVLAMLPWLRRSPALPSSLGAQVRRLPRGWARVLAVIDAGLILCAIGLLILGLARPRWPERGSRIQAESIALQVLLDVSGSMNEKDLLWQGENRQRLAAAKQVLRRLLEGDGDQFGGRYDDAIGLVTFAARSEEVCPPTLSHDAVLRLLDLAEPVGQPPESSTNVGDALLEGIELLKNARPASKVMILLTDGDHNVPSNVVTGAQTPRQAAQIAEALGIRVHTIFVGPGTNQSSSPQEDPPGLVTLRDVATKTGGRCFPATDGDELARACQAIDQLERTRLESQRFYRYVELYPWLGALAVLLVTSRIVLRGWRWSIVP